MNRGAHVTWCTTGKGVALFGSVRKQSGQANGRLSRAGHHGQAFPESYGQAFRTCRGDKRRRKQSQQRSFRAFHPFIPPSQRTSPSRPDGHTSRVPPQLSPPGEHQHETPKPRTAGSCSPPSRCQTQAHFVATEPNWSLGWRGARCHDSRLSRRRGSRRTFHQHLRRVEPSKVLGRGQYDDHANAHDELSNLTPINRILSLTSTSSLHLSCTTRPIWLPLDFGRAVERHTG